MSSNAGINPGHAVTGPPLIPPIPPPFVPGDPLFNIVTTGVPYQALVGDFVLTTDSSVTTPVGPVAGAYFAVKNLGSLPISIVGTVDGVTTYAIPPSASPSGQTATWFVWNAVGASWEVVSGYDPFALPIFVNCAALTAFPNAGLADKTEVRVQSVRDYFALDTTSTATLVTASVIATQSGTGRWIRQNRADPRWALESDWAINASTGNDENAGRTASPLRTPAELQRRIGGKTLQQFTTVTIATDLPDTTPLILSVVLGGNGAAGAATRLLIQGTERVVATGAVNTYTPLNRATQTTNSLVPTAPITWSTHQGRWVRMTSGAGSGFSAVITRDLGANTVSLSPFVQNVVGSASAPPSVPTTQPAIAPGDTFEIVEVPTVGALQVSATGEAPAATTGAVALTCQLQKVRCTKQGAQANFCGAYFDVTGDGTVGYAYMVDLGGAQCTGNVIRNVNCRFSGGCMSGMSLTSGGGPRFLAGAACGLTSGAAIGICITGAANVFWDQDFFLDGAVVEVGSSSPASYAYRSALTIGTAVMKNGGGATFGAALVVGPGAIVNQRTGNSGTALLWGTNNAGWGIRTMSNGHYVYLVVTPTINAGLGAGRETNIGGVDTLYAGVPAVNAANLASIVLEA